MVVFALAVGEHFEEEHAKGPDLSFGFSVFSENFRTLVVAFDLKLKIRIIT